MNKRNERLIEGSKIYLRKIRLSDANDNYHRWLNDPEINQYLESRHVPQTPEAIRQYVQEKIARDDEILLAICLKDNDMHIGNIKLGPINKAHSFASIGLFIGEKGYWGKGIATEAISLVTRFAFDVLGLHKVIAGCYVHNTGSLRAFEKAGFHKEGVEKEKWLCKGQYIDGIILGMVNSMKALVKKERIG